MTSGVQNELDFRYSSTYSTVVFVDDNRFFPSTPGNEVCVSPMGRTIVRCSVNHCLARSIQSACARRQARINTNLVSHRRAEEAWKKGDNAPEMLDDSLLLLLLFTPVSCPRSTAMGVCVCESRLRVFRSRLSVPWRKYFKSTGSISARSCTHSYSLGVRCATVSGVSLLPDRRHSFVFTQWTSMDNEVKSVWISRRKWFAEQRERGRLF